MDPKEQGELFPDEALTPDAAASDKKPDEAPRDNQNTDADPDPSTGQDNPDPPGQDKEPATMADAISAALKAGEENPLADDGGDTPTGDKSEKPPSDPDKSDEPVDVDDDDEDNPSEEELASYKPATQKRIKKLLSQRNEARRDAGAFEADAGNYRQIRQYMEANDLADENVAELLELGSHLKSGDPDRLAKFIDRVMPTLVSVMEYTGRLVPQDLSARVEQGDMTEDAAKDYARERASRTAAEERARRASTSVQQQQNTARASQVQNTIASWEQQVRASDPDFDLKAEAMSQAAKALVAERGLPATPDEALLYAKHTYQQVSKWFSSARPAPKATKPAPGNNGNSASRAGLSPNPGSLDEAIRNAMAAGARR